MARIFVGARICAGLIGSAFIATLASCSGGDDFKQGADGGTGGVAGASGGTAGASAGTGGGDAGSGGATAGSGGTSGGTGGDAGSDGGGSKPIGQSCATTGECQSGFCVDGVCCASACTGPCEGCAVVGYEGTCTPHAEGTDPGGDCAGDAGAGTCSGKCDGNGGCKFPGSTVSCGATTCSNGQESSSSCDGKGTCAPSQIQCAPYVCGVGACLEVCGADTDCVSTSFCGGTTCQSKKDNGLACTGVNQCKSAFCEQGVCCNKACSPPFVCGEGECKCNGQVCQAGDQCVTLYEDKDGDTFGNSLVSKLGCSSTAGWVTKAGDCDDLANKAFPGQTQYFATPRLNGTYDYNCDGLNTALYPNISGKTCGLCKPAAGGGCLGTCSFWTGGWGCGACPSSGPASGFAGAVACGATATLQTCNLSTYPTCGATASTGGSVQQACN